MVVSIAPLAVLGGDWSAHLGWCGGGGGRGVESLHQHSRGEERSSNKSLAAKDEAAAWRRGADQRDTRAYVVAARRDGGLDLALA